MKFGNALFFIQMSRAGSHTLLMVASLINVVLPRTAEQLHSGPTAFSAAESAENVLLRKADDIDPDDTRPCLQRTAPSCCGGSVDLPAPACSLSPQILASFHS